MITARAVLLGTAALLAWTGCGASEPPEDGPAGRTRLVLITLDTLRLDSLKPGDADSPMPLTAARAAKGHQFSRFFATTSITQPTHASILTGLHPWQHGVSRNGQVLAPSFSTVTERLKSFGFETSAVVSSFPVASRFGFAQGFDEYFEDFQRDFRGRKVWEKDWNVPGGQFFSTADQITELALSALDRAEGPRQFFWFHYFDPHAPYGDSKGEGIVHQHVKEKIEEGGADLEEMLNEVRALYRADVAHLDRALERVFARLDRDAGSFETHVLVVSDHGESLGEDASLGHGMRITDPQVRIPAFILSPTLEPAIRGQVASTVDVARTLLSLAGVPAPESGMEGRDLTARETHSGGAFGMRKTFASDPPKDLRLDGRRHPVPPYLFYAVDSEGNVFRGNASGVLAKSSAPFTGDTWSEDDLLRLFKGLEMQLEANVTIEETSPEVERALEALGYVR
jgi:arylsulfatase A-like enzyme